MRKFLIALFHHFVDKLLDSFNDGFLIRLIEKSVAVFEHVELNFIRSIDLLKLIDEILWYECLLSSRILDLHIANKFFLEPLEQLKGIFTVVVILFLSNEFQYFEIQGKNFLSNKYFRLIHWDLSMIEIFQGLFAEFNINLCKFLLNLLNARKNPTNSFKDTKMSSLVWCLSSKIHG